MYNLELKPVALSELEKLSSTIQERIVKKLVWLSENFEKITPINLTANLIGFFKLRVGDYRIIYTFDDNLKTITVHQIGHRRDIYKY
jgi:mRNA interferase RelE/StbE